MCLFINFQLYLSFVRSLIYSFDRQSVNPSIHIVNLLTHPLLRPIHFVRSLVYSFKSITNSFVHSVIHSFIRSFIRSFVRSFIHSFIIVRSFVRSFVHSYIHSFSQSVIHSFMHSCIRPSVHPSIHYSIHLKMGKPFSSFCQVCLYLKIVLIFVFKFTCHIDTIAKCGCCVTC
eukprot:jgi/Botrbrau1/15128/Bobra.0149s0001.1